MNEEEIRHFKSLLRQGSLRHMNILLDDKFQSELLNIIKDYELLIRENEILKENAKNNDKVVDKVNWENMLLKKENEQLENNWVKLKEYIRKNIIYDDVGMKILDTRPLEDYIAQLEQGSDSNDC